MAPALSLILPAHNEADYIAPCLDAVLASDPLGDGARLEIIVVPNGCVDATASIAHSYEKAAETKGWSLKVETLEGGGKLAALNAGESAAQADVLAYLDADVLVSPTLLCKTHSALSGADPAYASGQVRLMRSKSWFTNAYGRFYNTVPFMRQTAPGCGFFAMNKAGRARWDAWPDIISDDTFARLCFAPCERFQVEASYQWPLVEGFRNLLRVRRRQNTGVDQIGTLFPELLSNDAKQGFAPRDLLKSATRHPLGFLAYGLVSLCARLSQQDTTDWKRGR